MIEGEKKLKRQDKKIEKYTKLLVRTIIGETQHYNEEGGKNEKKRKIEETR